MNNNNDYKNENLNTINLQLGFYITGLIEADGNIWISKTFKSAKGHINNPQITFTFHLKKKSFFFRAFKTIF